MTPSPSRCIARALSIASVLALAAFARPAAARSFDALAADPALVLDDPATPGGFRVIALSHLAEACVWRHHNDQMTREAAIACVAGAVDAAHDPSIRSKNVGSDGQIKAHNGLYASHLAILHGVRDLADPAACDPDQHRRLAQRLADAATTHPSGVGRSFASSKARWPADQAATLYALWLYDRAHPASPLSEAPLARFLGAFPPTSLPPTEITGTAANHAIPRGSALSFTTRYLAPVAPAHARALWATMQREYIVRTPLAVGVREWPPDFSAPPDIDSGPIVAGIGASATAFRPGRRERAGRCADGAGARHPPGRSESAWPAPTPRSRALRTARSPSPSPRRPPQCGRARSRRSRRLRNALQACRADPSADPRARSSFEERESGFSAGPACDQGAPSGAGERGRLAIIALGAGS